MKIIKKILLFLPLLVYTKLLVINGKLDKNYTFGDFLKELDDIVN